MTRPSRNADRLLINAARELLPQQCCSELNIRQIARQAGVNLGMFHYHFKTKEEFFRVVLQEVYDEMFGKLVLEIDAKNSPFKNLKQALTVLGTFALENRKLLFPLLKDLMSGEPIVLDFAKRNFPRHLELLIALIVDCQKEKKLRDLPPSQLLISLMAGIAFPAILGAGLECRQPELLPPLHDSLLTKDALNARIEMTLKGVSP